MSSLIIYIIILILLIVFFAFFSIYIVLLIYSAIYGSLYVPTNKKLINSILKQADLKKGQKFLDLGCGDGRVVRLAVRQYQVKGIGVDVNILLIFWSHFLAKIQRIPDIEFRHMNILSESIPSADVIYIFLMPQLIDKISAKLKYRLNQGGLIISHGFKIKKISKFLIKKIDHRPFPTYYYQNRVNI